MKLRLALLALVFVVACGDDKKPPGQIIIPPDTGTPDTNVPDDGGMPDVENDTTVEPDVSTDTNVESPGFLNGVWVVKVSDVRVATLTIRHEEGQTAAEGSFVQVSPAAEGQLNSVTWIDDTMVASWTIRVDGNPETFGISEGASVEQNLMTGRYTESATGTFANCVLERQP
jgi:hypothetical protein